MRYFFFLYGVVTAFYISRAKVSSISSLCILCSIPVFVKNRVVVFSLPRFFLSFPFRFAARCCNFKLWAWSTPRLMFQTMRCRLFTYHKLAFHNDPASRSVLASRFHTFVCFVSALACHAALHHIPTRWCPRCRWINADTPLVRVLTPITLFPDYTAAQRDSGAAAGVSFQKRAGLPANIDADLCCM